MLTEFVVAHDHVGHAGPPAGPMRRMDDLFHGLQDDLMLLRRDVQVDARLFQHIGAAAFAGRGTIAVFGDRHARARRHERLR